MMSLIGSIVIKLFILFWLISSFDMSSVAGEMGFFEKYAIKYYAFILNLVLYAGVYELAGSMEIVLAAVYLLPRIGSFLPKDNLNETTNWK